MVSSDPGKISQPETRKSNLLLLAVLALGAFVILVAVIVIALFILPASPTPNETSASITGTGLPAYSGATRIELTKAEREAVLKQQFINSQEFGLNLALDLYTVKGSDREIALSYYNQELNKSGWMSYDKENKGASGGNIYLKNNKIAFVIYASGRSFANSAGTLAKKIRPEDTVLMVMLGEADFTKLPPKRQY